MTVQSSAETVTGRAGQRLELHGTVQGVGFRPFVYRLAGALGVDGWVRNAGGHVVIEASGAPSSLAAFVGRLRTEAPAAARIVRLVARDLPVPSPPGTGFAIAASTASAAASRDFPPDLATCDDCLRELFDPRDRRFRYPFLNCTNCGPRATIIDDLPYDRARTSMREFPMCRQCADEYDDPADRRFHAEPVACPECGPRLTWLPATPQSEPLPDATPREAPGAEPVLEGESALRAAVEIVEAGGIVAVKGLGGYQLVCDATNQQAVERLRARKHRPAKPFAVMVRDVAAAAAVARLSAAEEALLTSTARPIVLLDAWTHRDPAARTPTAMGVRPPTALDISTPTASGVGASIGLDVRTPAAPAVRARHALAAAVHPGIGQVGLFLPYTPLHHLLLHDLGQPLVVTSGNRSEEPIVIDDAEALRRLAGIADGFLRHDREIRARYDDSVTRVLGRAPSVIRRARGYAPEPVRLPVAAPRPLLAVGAHLKHTFTVATDDRALVGPHTGDLEDADTLAAFRWNLAHLERLEAVRPEFVAHDLHPGYLSTQHATTWPAHLRIPVQHHHAHVASCAAEHGLSGPFIGVAYDGLGLGDDGTFWGGEVLVADLCGYRRFARFGTAPLPGGAAAVRRPARMALGYLFGAENLGRPQTPGSPMTSGEPVEPVWSELAVAARGWLERLPAVEARTVARMVEHGVNSPLASSAGRLFDAVSSLLGLCDDATYEGEAAVLLEAAADPGEQDALAWRLEWRDGLLVYDPRPTIREVIDGMLAGEPVSRLAARFQNTIVAVTVALVTEAARRTGLRDVCLSGGVFQNRRLADGIVAALDRDGFRTRLNHRVPPNDGGISYGQAAIAAALLRRG